VKLLSPGLPGLSRYISLLYWFYWLLEIHVLIIKKMLYQIFILEEMLKNEPAYLNLADSFHLFTALFRLCSKLPIL